MAASRIRRFSGGRLGSGNSDCGLPCGSGPMCFHECLSTHVCQRVSVSVCRMPLIKKTALAEGVQWRPAHPWRWPRRLASAPASTDTVAAFRPWRSFRSSVARGRRGHHRRCVSDALKRAGKQTSRKLVWMLVGSAQSHVVKCAGSLTELLLANTSTGGRRSQGQAACGHVHTLDRGCPSPDAGWAV